MKISPRIVLANVVGLALVGGTLYVQQNRPEPEITSPVVSQIDAGLRDFIPVTDNNGDQIPDWQEEFGVIEVDLTDISSTTPYEADTVTQKMAADLASAFMYAEATEAQVNHKKLFEVIYDEHSEPFYDDQYTRDNIIISEDNSLVALRGYGNRVAIITFENSEGVGSETELSILQRARQENDSTILVEMDPLIAASEGMLEDMLATPVPSSLVREHLSLINVYQALLSDAIAMRGYFDDPVLGHARTERYAADVAAMRIAFTNLYSKLHTAGVRWSSLDTASRLVEVNAR